MKSLDIDECAAFLKVDRSTALRLAGAGELLGAKIGRAWVFLEDDVVAYLREQIRAQAAKRILTAQPIKIDVQESAKEKVDRRRKIAQIDWSKYDLPTTTSLPNPTL